MTDIKAVIFDMDGVLIDSEIVYLTYQYEVLHQKYPWVTFESLFPMVGMGSGEDIAFLAEILRKDINDPDFQEEIRDLFHNCTVDYPSILRPQVKPMLSTLKQNGYMVALASSSSTQTINTVLSECDIRHFFDVVVSGDQFVRSKPDPEIYQYTMKALQRQPKDCLIVEDSTYGVQAGHAAGAIVAALEDKRFPFDQRLAQYHIHTLDDVVKLLGIESMN